MQQQAPHATVRRVPVPPPLYAIADAEALAPRQIAAGAAEMAAAGVRWIQVRGKKLTDRDLFEQVERSCRAVEGSGAELWLDDRADLAALFPVAGVHLGQHDLPPGGARRVVGEAAWIGYSTHDEGQLGEADADPEVDLVALGPIFATTGKADPDPVLGVDHLRRLRRLTAKPLVAIGGINAGNIARVLAAGADSAAVLGAVCRGDVGRNCRTLLRATEGTA